MPKKQPSDAVLTIGLDVGYGWTKAITDSDTVIFPSVMGYAREISYGADQIAAKYPGDQLADDEGTWFIGALADSQLTTGQQLRLRGRTADEAAQGNVYRTRLAKAAIGKLLPNRRNGDVVHIRIGTGLPVDHMRDSAGLKSALIGQHLIHTDQANFIANITEVLVMPQPYGTIYANMLTETGEVNPCHTYTRTGVVDVGRYTVDLALDDDGEYLPQQSGSAEAGMWQAEDIISQAINRDYRHKPKHSDIEYLLQNDCLRLGGKVVNFNDLVRAAIEPVCASTLSLMGEKWQTGAGVDVIYLSGGGANARALAAAVKEAYPQTQLVEGAQTANARGYRHYAMFTAQN